VISQIRGKDDAVALDFVFGPFAYSTFFAVCQRDRSVIDVAAVPALSP